MWQTFLTSFTISALGSIPLGVINLTIMQISVNKGLKAAFQFIGIAILAEYFHVWLALWLFNFINQYPAIDSYFEWAAILFIFIMGIASLVKKKKEVTLKEENVSFVEAIVINFLNPFSIPFWLFFTTYALNANWINKEFNEITYCIAATLGALATLSFFGIGGKALTKWEFFKKLDIDKILGFTFMAMACWKFLKITLDF